MPSAALVATPSAIELMLDARDAQRKHDRARLAAARDAALAMHHPLAEWIDYWELGERLGEAQQSDLDAFYARWPGTYLEDRLRNDWLLELGRRRDWANYRVEYPRFVLKDDREAACYWQLVRHLDGQEVRRDALAAWMAQREPDDGCALLGQTLFEAGVIKPSEVWRKLRLAVEAHRSRLARQTGALIGEDVAKAVAELFDGPQRYLLRKASTKTHKGAELTTLALIRDGMDDPRDAASRLQARWAAHLPREAVAWIWASLGKQAATQLDAAASDYFLHSETVHRGARESALPDDTLAWKARAALRADDGKGRWQQVVQAIAAMSPSEQHEPVWVYWKAHALQALAPHSEDGGGLSTEARELLASIASPLHFYGQLAAEEIGEVPPLPPTPAPLTPEERDAATARPGLQRALLLIGLGLRSEGVREWNYTLRGLDDRQLLAAAQLACDREVWDRCINTSERTRASVDLAQRYPTPYRAAVLASARAAGIEPAYVFGLIRQESRFIADARSGAGASGLMQLMPRTAKWTAGKLGLDYDRGRLTDSDVNLRLGTGYLKMVLDNFEGSQALGSAAYNAGPMRPRRWREGPAVNAVAWVENIPFGETRDYVKKVLVNSTYYATLLRDAANDAPPSLHQRLGATIGPPPPELLVPEKDLP